MLAYPEYQYFIVKDEFQIYFPEGDFDIGLLAEWYRVIPTHPTDYKFYGDNTDLLKRHFQKFSAFSEVKTKMNNDMHSNPFLTVWCMAIYNTEKELVGFAAQEFVEGKPAEKKIQYYIELDDEEYCFPV